MAEYTDQALIDVWTFHMRAEGCTKRTIKSRMELLRHIARLSETPLIDLTRTQLMEYLGRPNISPRTRQHYRSGLHTFYALLQDEGIRLDSPAARLPKVKSVRVEVNPVTTTELQLLLESGIYARTRMMVLLYSYNGLRAAEIAAIHGRNIDWVNRRILTIDGKGGVEVWRPIHPVIWTEIEAQGFPDDAFWFPNNMKDNADYERGKGHVMAGNVSTVLGKAMKRAGIHHRPHQMRAWHATELMNAGADTMTAQFSMRHANQSTLQKYVKPSDTRIREAMERLPLVAVPSQSGRSRAVARA
jgi:integrase/recombinase XerD